MKKWILIAALVLTSVNVHAKTKKVRKASAGSSSSQTQNKTINMESQFDGLGSNEAIIEKARALQPNNSMKIVQKRAVDRDLRLELGLNYGYVAGGDTYVQTQNIGASMDFHITPRWSVGARYIDNRNALNSEAERMFEFAKNNPGSGVAPSVDFPLQTYLGIVNFYPIYGKVSWFESSVSQFDVYLLAGGGQIKLDSGSSPIYTGGLGVGMWWTDRFSSRFEARYQNYKDRILTGERNIDSMVFQVGIGFML